jgi:hypothetical protein
MLRDNLLPVKPDPYKGNLVVQVVSNSIREAMKADSFLSENQD